MAENTLYITEKFLSIQGESSYAGKPCFFIRLAGCNLDCAYCDTGYSRLTSQGQPEQIADIVRNAVDTGVKLAEITGGEPLLQDNTPELCRELLKAGFTVLVETNGSLPVVMLPEAVVKIVDVKTPSSGESDRNCYANLDVLTRRDEVKFVISDRNDYDFSKNIIRQYGLEQKVSELLFSAVWGRLSAEELAAWIIEDRLRVRLQLQLHKYIWGPEKKGV